MADAHLRHVGRSEDRKSYTRGALWRDPRGWHLARYSAGMGNLLRHSTLWRFADLSTRRSRRWLDGSFRGRRTVDRLRRQGGRARRHPYFRDSVALAKAPDERICVAFFAP